MNIARSIIINSDDFGLTRAINYAIVDSFKSNSISSTSLMVNTESTQHAISLMKDFEIKDVGVHISITSGKPVSNPSSIPSLVTDDGSFHTSKWWETNRADEDDVIREFNAQIERFVELTGLNPLHINHHHVIDYYGMYPQLALSMYKYQIPMRLTRDDSAYVYEFTERIMVHLKVGEYDFLNDISSEHIELPCHVGFISKDLVAMSSYVEQRIEDYAVVCDPNFKKAYTDAGFKLISWSEIKMK